jgi:hypothetical protein
MVCGHNVSEIMHFIDKIFHIFWFVERLAAGQLATVIKIYLGSETTISQCLTWG